MLGFSARTHKRSPISSAAIIGLVLLASLAVMVLVDVSCCASKRAGLLALVWSKATTRKPRRFPSGDLRYKR